MAQCRCVASTCGEETNYFDPIPVDLIITIFSRLPVKSMGLSRCVSKLWSSIVRLPNYNQLFPVKTPAPPRLLFAVKDAGELVFYSTPQPDQNTSLESTFHHRISDKDFYKPCHPVGGLLCRQRIEKNYTEAVVSNPMTGESLALPKVTREKIKTEWKDGNATYSLGYDPIDKQYKVLCITWLYRLSQKWPRECQVLTLGAGDGNLLWRKIQCGTMHYPLEDNHGICINGVLYYPAKTNSKNCTMVCFDVRSEKFSFVNNGPDLLATNITMHVNLIDFKGKLGVAIQHANHLEFWVLEDEWSNHTYRVHGKSLDVIGTTDSDELVFCPRDFKYAFNIYCYHLESTDVVTVPIQVPRFKKGCRVYSFFNYLEYEKLVSL